MGTKGKLLIIALLMSGIVALLVWSKNGDRKKTMPAAGANNGAIDSGGPIADDSLRPISEPGNGDNNHVPSPDPGPGDGSIRIETADGGSRTPPVVDTTSHQDPPPVVRPPATATKSYKVEKGDSLAKISMKVYGKEKYWQKIYEANKDKMSSPDDLLRVGTALSIPTIEEAPAAPVETVQTPPAVEPPVVRNDPPRNETAKKTYKVKAGDTLSSIAKTQLGDPNKWRTIFTANKDRLQNPDSLCEGMELLIP